MGGVSLFHKNDWEKINELLVTYLPKFKEALQPAINK